MKLQPQPLHKRLRCFPIRHSLWTVYHYLQDKERASQRHGLWCGIVRGACLTIEAVKHRQVSHSQQKIHHSNGLFDVKFPKCIYNQKNLCAECFKIQHEKQKNQVYANIRYWLGYPEQQLEKCTFHSKTYPQYRPSKLFYPLTTRIHCRVSLFASSHLLQTHLACPTHSQIMSYSRTVFTSTAPHRHMLDLIRSINFSII